jgi:uncharacterized membrane protein
VEVWKAILLGSVIVGATVVAVLIVVSSIAAKLDRVNQKLERIEWAITELERRVPDWLGRR